MGATATPYEDIQKQRIEANNRRMEELGLKDMSKSLTKSFVRPKAAPMVRKLKYHNINDNASIILRRSSRVAGTPQPDYRETDSEIPALRRRFSCSSSSRSSRLLPIKYCSDEARLATAAVAVELEKNLNSGCPSFVKLMLQSHVSGGFWLGLPSFFCQNYMPNKDTVFILEDEKGLEWETLYLAYKSGLSGGWRGFSIDHELQDGDALVFELVKAHRFKVHIVRANDEDGGGSEPVSKNGGENIKSTCEIPSETAVVDSKIVRYLQTKPGAPKRCPSKKQKINDKEAVSFKQEASSRASDEGTAAGAEAVLDDSTNTATKKSTGPSEISNGLQTKTVAPKPWTSKKQKIKKEDEGNEKESSSPTGLTTQNIIVKTENHDDTSKNLREENNSSLQGSEEAVADKITSSARLGSKRIAPRAGKIMEMLPAKKPHGKKNLLKAKAEA